MNKQNKHITPEWIISLSDCEIFVFGSNLEGQHAGGAARIAYEKFGAEWGVGTGPTGKCYAIPTMHGGLEAIRPYVDQFLIYAEEHPMNRFLLTRVGCGIAGFHDNDMARLFWRALDIPNITIPQKWLATMVAEHELIDPRTPAAEPVNYPDEDKLRQLSEKYAYQIGAGIIGSLPSVKVRYIKGENEFGYANFGDFYFYDDDLYVWESDDRWKECHNPDITEILFHDQCFNRGYLHRVIFAGARSPFKDTNDEYIYMGDIVRIDWNNGSPTCYAALECSVEGYIFKSCNGDITYSQIYRNGGCLTRVGTLFYNIEERAGSEDIRTICDDFVKNSASDMETVLQRAVITPSLGDSWQRHALGIIGADITGENKIKL